MGVVLAVALVPALVVALNAILGGVVERVHLSSGRLQECPGCARRMPAFVDVCGACNRWLP